MQRPDADIFEAQRPRLLRLAYRMLGSRASAEDIVQEAWLRWSRSPPPDLCAPAAYLSRIVSRLCLDDMKSARARRETYIGTWLPEPLGGQTEPAETGDDLTFSLMLALERLSPLERAAFLLHDVFDMPLGDVAETLGREAPAVRQLAARARQHVRQARPRFAVPRENGEKLARAFHKASSTGDLDSLRGLLLEDVTVRSDGGGKVVAFLNIIVGLAKALRLYRGLARKLGPDEQILRFLHLDGLPGYLSRRGGGLQLTLLDTDGDRVAHVYIIRNPDKLARLAADLSISTEGSA